jgi:hypothetical protein
MEEKGALSVTSVREERSTPASTTWVATTIVPSADAGASASVMRAARSGGL